MKIERLKANKCPCNWPQYPDGEYVLPGDRVQICIDTESYPETITIDSIKFNADNSFILCANSIEYTPLSINYPEPDILYTLMSQCIDFGLENADNIPLNSSDVRKFIYRQLAKYDKITESADVQEFSEFDGIGSGPDLNMNEFMIDKFDNNEAQS